MWGVEPAMTFMMFSTPGAVQAVNNISLGSSLGNEIGCLFYSEVCIPDPAASRLKSFLCMWSKERTGKKKAKQKRSAEDIVLARTFL